MTSRTLLHLAFVIHAIGWTMPAYAQDAPSDTPKMVATLPAAPEVAPVPPPPPPPSARDMVVEAIKNGSKEEIATVVKYAKKVSPGDDAEIETLHKEYLHSSAVKEARAKAEKEERIRNARFYDNWKGEGELGAFLTTGNTDSSGASGGIKLKREGIQWRHNIFASADYQRTNGVTSREYVVAGYKADWRINDALYAYGLAQYERDVMAGYDHRLSIGPGLGYKVINSPKMTLDLEAGASWRGTEYRSGENESAIVGRVAGNFGWQITPSLRLTENTAVHFVSRSASINALTSLDFKVSKKVSARLSYLLLHETDPLPARENTDGTTRFTVVYGF